MPFRRPLLILSFAVAAFAGSARAEDVALTFDDLPTLSLSPALDYAKVTTDTLLGGLNRHRWPAIGFVNEFKLEGPDKAQRTRLLEAWLDAGMDLGNHSYSHKSLTKTPVELYIADVERGETETRRLLEERGRKLRWYRHPYLETGTTLSIRRTLEDWLAGHGYRVAPVTVENSDWMFALVYDDAVMHGDAAKVKAIKRRYLAYTAAVVPWYRKAAFRLLHRPAALVFLLHASRLNADSLDDLAEILKRNRLRPVTLDKAMRDPAYAIEDRYAGPDGDEWITRWSDVLKKPLPWETFPMPPSDIAAEDQRLDGSL